MTQNDFDQVATWFETYVQSFTSLDPVTQTSLKSRYDHILRTCQEMSNLAGALDLELPQRSLAHTIALLHDIGRFEQFMQYGTFFDHVSTDHGILGATILDQTGAIAHLSPQEQNTITTAVKCHNRRALPADLSDRHRFYAELIRDADKLDVFETALDYYHRRQISGQNKDWEIELLDEPICSPQVVEALLTGAQIEYCHLQTIHDMQIAQIAWIYDVRFAPSYQRLSERKVLERLIRLLPEDSPREQIRQRLAGHIQRQINSANTVRHAGTIPAQ